MGGYRAERIAEMIHRELATRMRTEVKDAELEPVSITRVQVSGDLSVARISWMPLGGGEPARSLVDAVDRAAKKLRGPIGRALRLRTAPELRFVQDDHTEAAFRVNDLLHQISEDFRSRETGEE